MPILISNLNASPMRILLFSGPQKSMFVLELPSMLYNSDTIIQIISQFIAETMCRILTEISPTLGTWSSIFRPPVYFNHHCVDYFAGRVGVVCGFKIGFQTSTSSPIIPLALSELLTKYMSHQSICNRTLISELEVKQPCLESEVQHATDKLCESALILIHRYDLIKTAFLDAGWCSTLTHTVNFLGLLAALSNENTYEHIMVALVWFASVGLNAAQLTTISCDSMWSAFATNSASAALTWFASVGLNAATVATRPLTVV